MAQHEGIKMVQREITLNTVTYVICPDETTEGLIINTGKVVVPSDVVVTIQYSYNGTVWSNLGVSVTNTEVPLDGKNYKFIRIIKISGAGSGVIAIYGQGGGGGGAATINPSTGAMLIEDTTIPVAENNTDGVIEISPKLLATATDAPSQDKSTALEASSISKAVPGKFMKISGYTDASLGTGTYYLLVMNASALPPNGAVDLLIDPIVIKHTTSAPTAFSSIDYTPNGVYASQGIVWALSTTAPALTISSASVLATEHHK